jgi:hypothetical protein
MSYPAGATGFVLKEKPFSLCKVFCRHLHLGKTTCLRILRDKLGLKQFHLRWMLHAVCPINQPEERKSIVLEAPSDSPDVTEGERLSIYYHHG